VQSRQLDVVKQLVGYGAEVNLLTLGGNRPLHVAVQANAPAIAEFLIANGAEVDLPGGPQRVTPLHLAAFHGKIDVLRVLLAHGARTDLKNSGGQTPLMMAQRPAKSKRRQEDRHQAAEILTAYEKSQDTTGTP
jgi:ankyrin repeat protein